ncbi:MAG: sialidase family protein [Actinomycetes bacterium]
MPSRGIWTDGGVSMRLRRRLIATAAVATLAIVPVVVFTAGGAKATPFNYNSLAPIQKRLLSGAASYALTQPMSSGVQANSGVGPGDDEGSGEAASAAPKTYFPTDTSGCPNAHGQDRKVNRDCLALSDPDLQGRAQAQNETAVSHDPTDPSHLVATYNDYRRGDGTCGSTYSHDGGKSWADTTTPNGFTRGGAFGNKARQYWQASGDTSIAWDTRGNAYLSCQVFQRGFGVSPNEDQSSAFYVYRSTQNGGASYNFPGRPVREHNDTVGSGDTLLDKQYLTVDNHVGSPYRDRVYVTWTEFASNGTGYIYESYSSDFGETFSAPVIVSRGSPMCDLTYGLPTPKGKCNENQDSQPFTASDGTLYVVYSNYNNQTTGNDNRNQVLLSTSTDGGQSFGKPVRVSWFYDLPDCATYTGQDAGRGCVPTKSEQNSYFRAVNYPSGAADPKDPKHVVVTFGSYINRHSNESDGCVPAGFSDFFLNVFEGVTTPGACNNDIVLSTSNNGGASFTGANHDVRDLPVVTTTAAQGNTDQFWEWSTYTPSGRFVTTYYDRQYGNDENTGYSGITLSSSPDLHSWTQVAVTGSQMPPPTQFSGLFYGDYIGLTATDSTAYPIWSDTRDPDLFLCPGTGTPGNPPAVCEGSAPNAPRANDQNTYTALIGLP